jgi:hypothetical protein
MDASQNQFVSASIEDLQFRLDVATPVAAPEAPMQEHERVFLLNFADELRRKVPIGGM